MMERRQRDLFQSFVEAAVATIAELSEHGDVISLTTIGKRDPNSSSMQDYAFVHYLTG